MRYLFFIILFSINLLSMNKIVVYEDYTPVKNAKKKIQHNHKDFSFTSFTSDIATLKSIINFNKLKLYKKIPIKLSHGDRVAFKENPNFNNLPSSIKLLIFSLIEVTSFTEMLKQISCLFRTNFELMNIINGNYYYIINVMVKNYVQNLNCKEKNNILSQWINLIPKLESRKKILNSIRYALKLSGIDVNKDIDLLIAIKKATVEKTLKSYNTVKLLLDKNANVNAQDSIGNTCLIWATYCQNSMLVKLLLDYQADPNIKNEAGDSALIIALNKGNSNIVKLLLNNKADITVKDANGITAIELAKNILLNE